MKKPDQESIKNKAKEALTSLIPDNLVENAKTQLVDKVKESITGAVSNNVPESFKASAEKLMSSTDTDVIKKSTEKNADVVDAVEKNEPVGRVASPQSKTVAEPQAGSSVDANDLHQATEVSNDELPESIPQSEPVVEQQPLPNFIEDENVQNAQILKEHEAQPELADIPEQETEAASQPPIEPSFDPPVSPPIDPPIDPPPDPQNDPEFEDDEPTEPVMPQGPVSLKLALFGGAGIGLLFGVIMGMSVTPTVATVLGALTAMLAGILGMNDGHFSDAKAVRIGGFGFACVLGALLGLYVRAHNSMAPSLIEMKQEYLAVGFTEEQSLAFIAQKSLGATLGPVPAPENIPENTTDSETESGQAQDNDEAGEAPQLSQSPTATQTAAVQFNSPQMLTKQHASLLFSADVDISSCEEMENTDDTLPLDEVLNNFELTGDMWEVAYYWATENIDQSQQKTVMLAAKDAICSREKIEQEVCEKLSPLETALDNTQITTEFMSHESWQPMVDFVQQQGLDTNGQTQALLLIKNTICGSL